LSITVEGAIDAMIDQAMVRASGLKVVSPSRAIARAALRRKGYDMAVGTLAHVMGGAPRRAALEEWEAQNAGAMTSLEGIQRILAGPPPRKKPTRATPSLRPPKMTRLAALKQAMHMRHLSARRPPPEWRARLAKARVKDKFAAKLQDERERRARRARQIRLFHTARRALHRELGGKDRSRCEIPPGTLLDHRKEAAGREGSVDRLEEALGERPPMLPGEDPEVLNGAISVEEVLRVVDRLHVGVAPGDDEADVAFLKRIAKERGKDSLLLKEMAARFSELLAGKPVPEDWKLSAAVLLLKPGADVARPQSWRHVVLANTFSRIYASVLGSRLGGWMQNGRYAESQLGYLGDPVDHAWKMVEMLRLKNAFGSADRATNDRILEHYDVPAQFREAVLRLYADPAMYFRGVSDREDASGWVRLERGLRQGCPLSPFLFDCLINPLLLRLEKEGGEDGPGFRWPHGDRTSVLAFADDLAIIGRTVEEAEQLLRVCEDYFRVVGLEINPEKSMSGSRRRLPMHDGGSLLQVPRIPAEPRAGLGADHQEGEGEVRVPPQGHR